MVLGCGGCGRWFPCVTLIVEGIRVILILRILEDVMTALVVRDGTDSRSDSPRVIDSVDVTGMSASKIDRLEAQLISKHDELGDFQDRYTIALED